MTTAKIALCLVALVLLLCTRADLITDELSGDALNALQRVRHIGSVPTRKLANGVAMPMLGLGTWEYNNSVAYEASLLALLLGYPHIDTATMYKNQHGVGAALRKWREIRPRAHRDDVFLTTKIPGGLNYSAAAAALDATLEALQVDHVDLMLVHFPAGWDGKGGRELRVDGWRAVQDFYEAGKARAVGVSHFCRHHIEDLLAADLMKPHVNQVEFHVGMGRAGGDATDDRDYCEANGILYQSFSPLCGPCGTDELVSGELVTGIGAKYNKTGAQVSLRWQVQQGIPVIPKTDREEHMLENADIFDWELSDQDMRTLTESESPPVTGGGGDGTSGDCKIE